MKKNEMLKKVALVASIAGAFAFAGTSCSGGGSAHHEGDGHDHHEDGGHGHSAEEHAENAHGNHHWSYDGETSPAHWATLCDDFSACAGHNQSPIDLTGSEMKEGLGELMVQYADSLSFSAVNNGHTVQVNIAEDGSLAIEGRTYKLKQFHFHTSSEHTVDGKKFPMEIHLVHVDDSSNIAVIGILFTEGAENPFLASFINALPATAETDTVADFNFTLASLFPKDKTYFRYSGSLTTPPCSEGVVWTVLKTPVTASKEQIEKMASMMPKENARPVQKLNERTVYSN